VELIIWRVGDRAIVRVWSPWAAFGRQGDDELVAPGSGSIVPIDSLVAARGRFPLRMKTCRPRATTFRPFSRFARVWWRCCLSSVRGAG